VSQSRRVFRTKDTTKRAKDRRRIKRGIYLLPSLFTSLSLFCGFYSVTASFNEKFIYASWAIILAAVFDAIDGRIARLTHSVSEFGEQYDSLSDMISFGIAPGILVYTWALQPFGRWGWLAAFLYVICVALRLARFNLKTSSIENRYFQGLPSPSSAAMVATTVIIFYSLGIAEMKNVTIPLLTCMLALLMVSTLKYHTFKEFDFRRRMPFNVLVACIFLLIIFLGKPKVLLFTGAVLYTLSGPVGFLFGMRSKKHNSEAADEASEYTKGSHAGDSHGKA
jgi:CDP-diacylglycerol--serine O-phosphatidyltransferase